MFLWKGMHLLQAGDHLVIDLQILMEVTEEPFLLK